MKFFENLPKSRFQNGLISEGKKITVLWELREMNLSDTEIAKKLNIVRRTVQYRQISSINKMDDLE